MSSAVLDASALLAFLKREPGEAIVAPLLADAVISAVNLSEVVAKLAEDQLPARQLIPALLASSGLTVAPFDEEMAILTGDLRPATRAYGLSLGDRACLALAEHLHLPAITTETRWDGLPLQVDIRRIR